MTTSGVREDLTPDEVVNLLAFMALIRDQKPKSVWSATVLFLSGANLGVVARFLRVTPESLERITARAHRHIFGDTRCTCERICRA